MALKILTCCITLSPARITPSAALITPLPANIFINKLAPNVSHNIPRNPHFYSFSSFLIVSLTPFINKPDSSGDLTICIISSIYLFEITHAIVPDWKVFSWIATSVAEAAAVNPNGIKTLFANSVSTFFINGKPADINGLRKLRNPPLWLLVFLVVRFSKIAPFSKKLFTFI